VTDIALWPPRVALVQLRMAPTEQAKPYRLGTSIKGIFAALRARFGISAVDVRVRLQRLCRGPRTPLQEHVAAVKRLAQMAYSDLPALRQQRYTYNAFVQPTSDGIPSTSGEYHAGPIDWTVNGTRFLSHSQTVSPLYQRLSSSVASSGDGGTRQDPSQAKLLPTGAPET